MTVALSPKTGAEPDCRPTEARPAGDGEGHAEPLWLTGGRWPLFAWVHHPARPVGGLAILCPPLLCEHAAAYHLYRDVARGLAARGVTVVRFDYEGTGDSAGPPEGAGRVQVWLDGVDQAIRAGRQTASGALALVGVRSGALVAGLAAQRRADVDAMVLWDPWTTGKAFLRRQQALQAMRFSVSGPPGEVEAPGFTVDAVTAADVASLRLPTRPRVRRALVLVRPGVALAPLPLAHRAAGSAALATADIDTTAPGEQESLFDVDPLHRTKPTETTTQAVAWLSTTLPALSGEGSGPSAGAAAGTDGPARGRAIGGAGAGVRRGAVAVDGTPEGRTVYEEPVWLGRHRLFAIETRPRLDSAGAPVVLLLSSGTDSHVGPSRLWVTLARRWASQGARCLRVDLSGWGESAPRSGRPELVLRAPEAFDDVLEAVAGAGAEPRRTVLVGLCSGAYQALESAFELAPLGVLAINPLLRFTPPELTERGEVSPRRRLCDPRPPWVDGARASVPSPVRRAAVAARGAFRRLRETPPVGSWLERLAAQGVHVYCLGGEAELRQLPTPASTGGPVRVELLPGLDHALLGADQRTEVVERVTAELWRIARAADGPTVIRR